jgi:hypothetical protein
MQHRGRAALSAPRPTPKCNRASAPVDVVHRRDHEPSALHVSRPLRDVCFHDSIPLGVWQRHDREGHDFSPALSPGARNSRIQHRGRAALQRRVPPLNATGLQPRRSGCEPGEEPAVRFRRHEPSVPPCLASFARHMLPRPHPSEDSAAPQPGRPRLQSCRKTRRNVTKSRRDDSTIARRFNAGSRK